MIKIGIDKVDHYNLFVNKIFNSTEQHIQVGIYNTLSTNPSCIYDIDAGSSVDVGAGYNCRITPGSPVGIYAIKVNGNEIGKFQVETGGSLLLQMSYDITYKFIDDEQKFTVFSYVFGNAWINMEILAPTDSSDKLRFNLSIP